MKENPKKIKNLIVHFAQEEVLHLGKKKLAKLLYFVDFTNYELQGESVTGLQYGKWPYGPVPVSYYKILERLKKDGAIKIQIASQKYMPEKITTNQKVDYTVFNENELKIIKQITERFKNETASTIEAAAKQEPPYKMVKDNEAIPYHLAYYRNSFDEMSLDENSN